MQYAHGAAARKTGSLLGPRDRGTARSTAKISSRPFLPWPQRGRRRVPGNPRRGLPLSGLPRHRDASGDDHAFFARSGSGGGGVDVVAQTGPLTLPLSRREREFLRLLLRSRNRQPLTPTLSRGEREQMMKAIAVFPRKPDSVHLAELPKPSLDKVPNGRGVLIRVLRCGVDGTDKEINAGDYGASPSGCDFLVLGHENFGQVEAVGENVTEVAPGDYVVATVRRPGMSLYDAIGTSDMTTDDSYFEHGINLLHGFLTEYSVEDADFVVKVPQGLKNVAVLLEPLTVAEKGITQAYEIQRRLRVWRPRRAAVMGAGTIGLLATLILRLRGMAVTTFGLTPQPYLN